MEDRIRKSAKGCREVVDPKHGVYRIYFSLGKDPVTGKYLRTKKRTVRCKSKNPKNWPREIDNALAEYRLELENGSVSRGAAKTLSEYAESFHLMRKGTMGSPLAYEREGYDIRHIQELFGETRIRDLRPGDIKQAYATAREKGRFSESELHRIHVKLRQIMDAAVADEYVPKNPCSTISVPMPKDITRKAPPLEEVRRMWAELLAEEPCAQAIATMLIIDLGLRKGEALGLTWKNYDCETGEALIVQQFTNDKKLRRPKSTNSNRRITASATLRECLIQWKSIQAELFARCGIAQCPETPIAHSIRSHKDEGGTYAEVIHMDNKNYARWFRNFAVDNGFGTYKTVTSEFTRAGKKRIRGTGYEGICPHMLRHAQATYLIGSGTDIKTVQARLGHASPNTTLSIYSHAIAANDRLAADTFESLLSASPKANQ